MGDWWTLNPAAARESEKGLIPLVQQLPTDVGSSSVPSRDTLTSRP
jgi:hypothetical protein